MKVVELHEWTPKKFFEPHIEHKNSPIGPQKVKTTSKLSDFPWNNVIWTLSYFQFFLYSGLHIAANNLYYHKLKKCD